MERPRAPPPPPVPPLRRLLAAAVLVQCCARLGLGSGTGSALGVTVPCAHPGTAAGERCRTDPQRGAGAGRTPTPAAVGGLQTEAELLPFPGTPAGAAEPPGPQGSPRDPRAGREGTGSLVQDGAATERPGPPLSAGSEQPSPASLGVPSVGVPSVGVPAPAEPDTDPATRHPPRTDPVGNVTAEGATTPQGTPTVVPSSAGGRRGSPSPLPGQSPPVMALVRGQGHPHGPSSPERWAGEGPSVTVPLGDSGPGTLSSIAPATVTPALGTVGVSPSVGGLQKLLSPAGTQGGSRQGTLGPAGGRGSGSHLGRGTDAAWGGPRAAPRPSLPSLGAGGRGDPVGSTTRPALGTDPTPLPAAGEGPGLPVPPATASAPGVTSLGAGGAVDPTTGELVAPGTEGPPERGHVPPDQTWPPPARPGQPPAPGSTAAAQSGVSPAPPGSPRVPPGSPRVPLSPQPAPAGSSAAPTSPAPQPPMGTSRGVLGLGPTAGNPPAPLSPGHRPSPTSSGGDPAESPQTLGGTLRGVGDAKPWTAAAQPSVTATAVTATAVTATAVTVTAAAASPALPGDVGTVTPEPSAAVSRGDTAGLTWGPPTHPPTVVPGPPQQPTRPPGVLGDRGGPGSSPAAGDTDLVPLSSSPGGHPGADTPRVTPALGAAGRAPPVFIVEDQPPLRRASLLRVPCELVLAMAFVPTLRDPASPERRRLLLSFNRTVSPLFAPVPGFLRLEVTGIRAGSVVLEYDALFAAEHVPVPGLGTILNATLGSGAARRGLAVGAAPVLRHTALARPLDPCAELFSCRGGFACVAGADGNATCTSLCHRGYCKNHGICTHPPDHGPLCRCPVGSDFWFVGLRCDVRVTQQSLLGVAAGVLLSIVLLGAAIATVAVRRFKALLLEARADQTRSSYRRFCRLDEVSGQWWPPSASSLDNPAFSASEELLHLHVLDGGCREHAGITRGSKHRPRPPARRGSRPSFQYDWDTSSSSMNDPMVDSGKASDISVSSWPLEPLPWAPFPLLHQLSRQRPPPARRPRSFCEGMELGTLERSWTA